MTELVKALKYLRINLEGTGVVLKAYNDVVHIKYNNENIREVPQEFVINFADKLLKQVRILMKEEFL